MFHYSICVNLFVRVDFQSLATCITCQGQELNSKNVQDCEVLFHKQLDDFNLFLVLVQCAMDSTVLNFPVTQGDTENQLVSVWYNDFFKNRLTI